MAPSFISLLMGADKRATSTNTISVPAEPSGVVRPHLVRGRSACADSLQLLNGFQRPPFGQIQAPATLVRSTTAHWNDREKVQDFFRHTTSRSDHNNGTTSPKRTPTEAGQSTEYNAIDSKWHSEPGSRDTSVTSLSSSEDNQLEFPGIIHGRGRVHAALEELDATQQADELEDVVDQTSWTKTRRRYDSFDILADVRLSEEIEAEDVDSVASTPARSRANSEENCFGAGLLDLLSQRHMPVGLHRHTSVADMLGHCARGRPVDDVDDDEPYQERPAICGPEAVAETHTVLAELRAQRKDSTPKHAHDTKTDAPGTCTRADCDPLEESVPLKSHPVYQKYFQMLKVGLPVVVVKHKMQSDDVDPSILDHNPNEPLPQVSPLVDPAETVYQTQLQEYEAKHSKYVQMLKMGLPQAAVEHKMRMDGVDVAWLHGPPTRASDARVVHREKYQKYFQMLRLGLPRGAVEQKMRMAGLDPVALDGPEAESRIQDVPAPRLKRKDSIRKKLHWEGKKHRRRRDSVWGGDAVEQAKDAVQISAESRAVLEQLFVKDLTAVVAPEAHKPKPKAVVTHLLDMKKAQNIAIALARVKVPFATLPHEILAMNATVLSPSQVRSLLDMWPDRRELAALEAFRGDVASLGTAEQFFLALRAVPRVPEKLNCLLLKQELPARVQELRASLNLVIDGVDQVCASVELRQVLMYILQIGNLLNCGSDDGVEAFSLRSLMKLSQTKAFVGGITFLQYVVQSIERDVPHLAQFDHALDLLATCSKVSYASLVAEKQALERGLEKLVQEAHASAVDDERLRGYHTTVTSVCTDVKGELQALQGRFEALSSAKAHFLAYFEEEETDEELNVLLSYIADFIAEYGREHAKYRAQMKRKETVTRREDEAKDEGKTGTKRVARVS